MNKPIFTLTKPAMKKNNLLIITLLIAGGTQLLTAQTIHKGETRIIKEEITSLVKQPVKVQPHEEIISQPIRTHAEYAPIKEAAVPQAEPVATPNIPAEENKELPTKKQNG